MVRIDGFAPLNNTLGHRNGDDLLHAVGLRLREMIDGLAQGAPGSEDHPGAGWRYHLAHLGGEQFVITVADSVGHDELVKIGRLAQHAITAASRSLAWIDGYQLKLNTIAGIVEGPATADGPGDEGDAERWLRNAHIAAEWARADRQPHAVYEPDRARADLYRHRLTAAMPDALDRGEFRPVFQPIYALADRTFIGVEAWPAGGSAATPLRWDRKNSSPQPNRPDSFAPSDGPSCARPAPTAAPGTPPATNC